MNVENKTLTLKRSVSKIAIESLIAICGSIFLVICAQIAIPLPFTPVPMTLQTLAVFLLGGSLGSKRAAYSVIGYLIQGTCGLPVFAGGKINPFWILDIKAGFLLSFVLAAFIVGKLIERKPNGNLFYFLFSMFVGDLVIYTMGVSWLSFYFGISKAIAFGFLPFISCAILKSITGAFLLKSYAFIKNDLLQKPKL
ncbi:MAG: biotin transporter BioY [Chlamydiae bacterium]|nr:biotin transporter BioY [Chlamydiota bacterium]